ncbi:MAG TPA: hypothetical protein VF384_12200 [Planctomycetota bacterium]
MLLLGRAFGFAVLVVALIAVPVWALGLVPAGGVTWYAAGIGASLFAAMLAICVHGRFLDSRAPSAYAHDGRLMAGRLQSLLAIAFGAKLAVLVLGVFLLRQADVKFEALATFCITFAAVSLVSQLATAAYLSRAMSQRANGAPAPPGHRNAGTQSAESGAKPTEQDHQP